jgi:hypothetical protein
MHAVALDVGESPLVAWLFPLSVDGLAVVASVALLGPDHHAAPAAPPAAVADVQVLDDPAPADQPTAPQPAAVSLFVPPLVGASSPALNGSGSMQPTNPNTLR